MKKIITTTIGMSLMSLVFLFAQTDNSEKRFFTKEQIMRAASKSSSAKQTGKRFTEKPAATSAPAIITETPLSEKKAALNKNSK